MSFGLFDMFQKYDYTRVDLTGKVALVTGANIGLGLETARQLAELKAKVYLACRNEKKAQESIEDIKSTTGNQAIHFLPLDLSKFKSVRSLAADFNQTDQPLDILIHNAGLVNVQAVFTEDGLESTVQCNYFSPILLTTLLLPSLKKSQSARVVNVGSEAYKFGTFDLDHLSGVKDYGSWYPAMNVYGTAKLYLLMASNELSKSLSQYNILVNTTHPGFINTDIWKKDELTKKWYSSFLVPLMSFVAYLFLRSPSYAARTSLHAAVDPSVKSGGGYYVSNKIVEPPFVKNDSASNNRRLLEKTFAMLELDLDSL